MDTYHISGGRKLYGVAETAGAKNAVLPLLAAAAVIYGAGTYLSYRKAAQNYEKVDL